MPPVAAFIGGIGASIAAGVGITLAATSLTAFVVGAATLTLGVYALRQSARLADPLDATRGANGRSIMVRSTDSPRNIAYGKVALSGTMTFANSTGTENRELYYEIVLTGHEIDSYLGWYLDDRYVPIADVDDINASPSGDGGVDADTNSHGYGPVDGDHVLYLRGHLGTTAQAVDAQLDTAFTEIGTTHRHRECARLNVRMDMLEGAEPAWERGPPGTIRAEIQGKKVYDPRLDSTFSGDWGTGSGAHRVNDPTTWAYSANPALIWADYRIDSDLGPGWDSARIDYDSVAFAADTCEGLVDIPPAASPANQEARWECHLVVNTAMTHEEIIEQILLCMVGRERYVNGLWRVYANGWQATDFAMDEDDLVGEIQYRMQPEADERFNQVRGTYFDPDRLYKRSQFLTWTDATLRTNRDNGRTLHRDIEINGVRSEYQCQRIARRLVLQGDDTGLLTYPVGYQGMDIMPGDTGTVSSAELGWVNKTFRCVGVKMLDFVGVELLLKEDDSSNYGDPLVGDYGTRTAAGTITFPRLRANVYSEVGNLVADPFFRRSVELWDGTAGEQRQYFWTNRQDGVNSTTSLVRTGGSTGSGLLRMVSDGGAGTTYTARAGSIGYEPQLGVAGEYLIVSLRVRRTSAAPSVPSPDVPAAIIVDVGLGDDDGVIGNFGNESSFTRSHTQVAAWTTNQWQQFSFYMQAGLLSLASFSGPYVVVQIDVHSEIDAMTIEFDAVTVQRAPDPTL